METVEEMRIQVVLPRVRDLLDSVKREDRPQGEELTAFWLAVAVELGEILHAATVARIPQIQLNNCRHEGRQYIWEFWVNDMAKTRQNMQINWHGQNTSQWVYAGAIVLTDGRVSTHH